MTKYNLFAAASESLEEHAPKPQTQTNGHAAADQTNTNGHTHAAPEQQEGGSTETDHQAETVNQNHVRKKDGGHLATVAEETNGDGEERYRWLGLGLAVDRSINSGRYHRVIYRLTKSVSGVTE